MISRLFTGNLPEAPFLHKVGGVGNVARFFDNLYNEEAEEDHDQCIMELMEEVEPFGEDGASSENAENQLLIHDICRAANDHEAGITSDAESAHVREMFGGSGICEVSVQNQSIRKTRIRVAGQLVKLGATNVFLKNVMPQGKPAAFGDIANQETRVDESVRVATEFTEFEWLDKDGNEVDPMTSEATTSIAAAVYNITTRVTGAKVKLTKYKLNIYDKGGFFKKHVDHPLDSGRTIGTLVVLLPTQFEGGLLELYSGDVVVNVHGKYPVACAFLGAIPHEVTEVTSGCRVTLTYAIDLVPSEAVAMPKPKMSVFLRNRLLEAFPGHRQLGVLFGGLYTPEAITQYGTQCLTDAKDTRLCNYIMVRLGFRNARVIPVVVDLYGSPEDEDSGISGHHNAEVFQISLPRWDQLCRGELPDPEDKTEFLQGSTTFLWPYGHNGESILWKRRSPSFAGNESEPGYLRCIHFQAALVFSLSDEPVELGKRKASSGGNGRKRKASTGGGKRRRTAKTE